MKKLEDLKIGCIGIGTMGGAIIQSMLKIVDAKNVFVSSSHFEKAQDFAQKTGCVACKTNQEVANNATDFLFLAVKPAQLSVAISGIFVAPKTVVVSMLAGTKIETLKKYFSNAIVRIMPNMPALIGESMTALCCDSIENGVVSNLASEKLSASGNFEKNEVASEVCMTDVSSKSVQVPSSADFVLNAENLETLTELLKTSGRVEQVKESLMDCVTGVSGSSPAFVFMFIEALADAAVRNGMPRKQAYIYAAQTVKGSASMVLEDLRCPSELKDCVCSPSGTTIEGVAVLEKNAFRSSVIEAVTASCKKSEMLAKRS